MKFKNLLFLSLPFLLISFSLKAQTLTGTVLKPNQKPIPEVMVYFDNSQVQGKSDLNGKFSLPYAKGLTNRGVVFEKEGFKTLVLSLDSVLKNTTGIILTPVTTLKEVKVVGRLGNERRWVLFFRQTFLGSSGSGVKIKNPRALYYNYSPGPNFLQVSASSKLTIQNKILGYVLYYNLMDYEADLNLNTVIFSGTVLFQKTDDGLKSKLNRMNAYYGSIQHFMRSLYQNKLTEDGFNVNLVRKVANSKYPTPEQIAYANYYYKQFFQHQDIPQEIMDSVGHISARKTSEPDSLWLVLKTGISKSEFVIIKDGHQFLHANERLQIVYHKVPFILDGKKIIPGSYSTDESSFLLLSQADSFEIFADGSFENPSGLMIDGDFSKRKVGTMLPLDYVIGE